MNCDYTEGVPYRGPMRAQEVDRLAVAMGALGLPAAVEYWPHWAKGNASPAYAFAECPLFRVEVWPYYSGDCGYFSFSAWCGHPSEFPRNSSNHLAVLDVPYGVMTGTVAAIVRDLFRSRCGS